MSFFCFVYVIDSGLHSFPTRRSSDLMMLLVQMFRMAWQPFFLRESDDPEAPRLYRDVFRYFNGIAGICFLVVALFAQQIVQIKIPLLDVYLVGEEYWAGLQIVPVRSEERRVGRGG